MARRSCRTTPALRRTSSTAPCLPCPEGEPESHYSSATSDVEYLFSCGWGELEGIANRADFDLTQHAKFSGEKIDYVDPSTGERYVPHVIDPSAGADRATLAFMVDAYDEEEVEGRQRVVLRLHRRQDEIGTPWGVTVDHQTMEDRTVTVRDRDSLEQTRVAIDGLGAELERRLAAPWKSPKAG